MNPQVQSAVKRNQPENNPRTEKGRAVEARMVLFPKNNPPAKKMGHFVAGTGTISSECGTTAYSMEGALSCNIADEGAHLSSLRLIGRRLSGFDAGEMRINLSEGLHGAVTAGQLELSGSCLYSDDNNSDLPLEITLKGTLSDGVPKKWELSAAGNGFNFALFLADGERLDEESGGPEEGLPGQNNPDDGCNEEKGK
jgi:hypothetical protein